MSEVLTAARDASPRRGDAAGLAGQIADLLAESDPLHPAAREVLAELLAEVCRHCGDDVRRDERAGRWIHASPECHGAPHPALEITTTGFECPWVAVRDDLRDRILTLGDYLSCDEPEVEFAARVGDPDHPAMRARLVLLRTLRRCLIESLVARPFCS